MATPTQTRYATLTVDDEEYRLEPGDSLSIGRHRENDVVIHSASVSRFHASVRWLDGRSPEIVDHGSQNGTVMGGLEIRRRPAPLRDGVVILIGSRVMQVRLRNPGDAALLEDAPEIVALYTDQRPELTGSVDSADELARLLRTLETEERTGTLHVLPTDVEGGRITVCMGLIMAVEKGLALRTRALEQLLGLKVRCDYRFTPDFEPTDSPMNLWFSDFTRRWQRGFTPKRPHRVQTHRSQRDVG